MASASKRNVVTITLTLTEAEAEALYLVTNHVGGAPETTPRGDIDSIRRALADAGMDSYSYINSNHDVTGSIRFN